MEIRGRSHPLIATVAEIQSIFASLGFSAATGPERETEFYNFDALNVPADHPARDMQDTFWIDEDTSAIDSAVSIPGVSRRRVLRTHTTSATARYLESVAASDNFPCAYYSCGKVFRNEATDATHEMNFYQIDGCMVGRDISLANLKYILLELYRRLLGDDVEIQLRPSFFPFVEPGLEVWVRFRNRWLEVMGAGMLHPQVLRNVGIDPEQYQGFAFGGGVDRIVMVKYDIPDVRYLYQGDLRLNQW
jgi:phenylalanyl-tRNA synthetase alpha chain